MNKNDKAGLEQTQFLKILSREAAIEAFEAALRPCSVGTETVTLDVLAGRVLAQDVEAQVDAPPFDRSVVDGFAVRAADLAEASPGNPVLLRLNGELIACGVEPRLTVGAGTATPISTGGPIPRGADAVVMIEHTEPGEGAVTVTRALAPGQNMAFAGSDIARGQVVLRQGTRIGSREIAMLAAVGLARVEVYRRPRVAVLSTGDELAQPGEPLGPAQVYDSNGPIVAAALEENGCIALRWGAIRDEEALLEAAIRSALREADGVVLSGGTSKGAGDFTYRILSRFGPPGIVTHGVALKPGKPLCLAVCQGKPVVVLPGFPTSAMFTFHDIVAPFFRRLAGLPAETATSVEARVPVRIPSDLGRTEFVMVALAQGADGLVAHPIGKGSGAVTAFSQADGFLAIDALSDSLAAGERTRVQLFAPHLRLPDLVVMGSHCTGLDAALGPFEARGLNARVLALGSLGGLSALARGECDLAPIHLLDPAAGEYNRPFLRPGMVLIPGWRRLQGLVFRKGDARFEGRDLKAAAGAALADPDAVMVNRNQGAGTRTLIEGLLAGAKPQGYWNQPRSHHAVVASVAQGRSDWGVAIKPLAEAAGLGFIPLADEHYDFAVAAEPVRPGMIDAFRASLAESAERLLALGFDPR
ncbi:MAG TPA: molybdopterin biosynthesis protein [Rhabdaerophilum sp.]|nr:molybdopterin biosynthesis protein [Rhabdaerophilum sp.]